MIFVGSVGFPFFLCSYCSSTPKFILFVLFLSKQKQKSILLKKVETDIVLDLSRNAAA